MKFEWNEVKNQGNINKHGVDFNYAVSVFLDLNRVEWEDKRRNYGEKRYITIGMIEDMLYTVVYTWRSDHCRIISARGASRGERQTYHCYVESD